jgi:tetratricopeptide (TPR) repeat protein
MVDPNNRYVWLSWAVYEATQGFVDRARSLLTRGCKLNPGDPPLLQALARLEASEGNITMARILFEQGTKLDPLHQANWQAWALAEWKVGNIDYARELLQRGVWVSPRSENASKLFHAWGVLEEREGNIELARQLYKCGIRADPTSEMTWLTWALMEEKQGNDVRAGELRNLCVQQRAEEAVGQSDLSPAAMFGIDSALRPILRSLTILLGNQMPTQENLNNYADSKGLSEQVEQAEPLFGVMQDE